MHPDTFRALRVSLERFQAALPPEKQIRLDGLGTNTLEAWFLGPKAENQQILLSLISQAAGRQVYWRAAEVHPEDPRFITPAAQQSSDYRKTVAFMQQEFDTLLFQLKHSAPFFSMRHQGHMLWDTTLPGAVGYFAAMLFNQNNVAVEASPITTLMEMAVGDDLCRMLGYPVPDEDAGGEAPAVRPWGHITCDGTVANIEAAWAARNLKYYPVSLRAALDRPDSPLAPAADLEVTGTDGTCARLRDLDPWTLLNLPIDETLALPTRLDKEYGIATSITDAEVSRFSAQTLGMADFHETFLRPHGIGQPVLFVPATRHYSWPKAAALLGIGAANLLKISVDLDARQIVTDESVPAGGRSLTQALEVCLDQRIPVLMSVAVIGSTEESAIDPLASIVEQRERFRQRGLEFAIHCDAAWGGYFASLLRKNSPSPTDALRDLPAPAPRDVIPTLPMSAYAVRQYQALPRADSITVDPHKAGFIPYPAGGLCYRNSALRSLVSFSSPVVYRGQSEPTVGIYGVEGSKPGAAAAAVYLSHKIIRPTQRGYGQILGQCLFTHKKLFARLVTMARHDDPFTVTMLNRIPAERQGLPPSRVAAQLKKIRREFVNKTNAQIVARPDFQSLFLELGSDQVIIAYAFNFKGADGALNTDILQANALNAAVFKACSMRPDVDPNTLPLIVTSSQFAPEDYGSAFMTSFQERMGLTPDPSVPIYFLISTQMDPWLTETEADPTNGFLTVIEDALRSVLRGIIPGFQQPPDPSVPA